MKGFVVRNVVVALLLLTGLSSYAAQDSLVLYTKPDCSNCRATKLMLHSSGISYIEKSLDNTAYATEMLQKLAAAGYHKEIYLPVIFLNNKLYHPALRSDTGLVSVPLENVVDSIKYKYQRGELHLPAFNSTEVVVPENNTKHFSNSSDCEVKTSPVYLITAEYNTEAEAKADMNKLINSGYTFAGMIFYQNKYKVFCKFFYDYGAANTELNLLRNKYPKAYMMEVPG